VQLAKGKRAVVRPALPQDRDLNGAFVRTLSDEARYFRFMTKLSELPETMAEQLTSIDYRSHVALVATIFTGAGETMIGEARYIADDSDPGACEFVVAVADDWQGIGLASTLLGQLVDHAAGSSISRISADSLSGILDHAPLRSKECMPTTLVRKHIRGYLIQFLRGRRLLNLGSTPVECRSC
jgi:acetyltransferase